MDGVSEDVGMVKCFADDLFLKLEDLRYQNSSFNFFVRIRFVEILDEEVHDLLQAQGAQGFGKQHIRVDEWEGTHVAGTQWIQIPNSS